MEMISQPIRFETLDGPYELQIHLQKVGSRYYAILEQSLTVCSVFEVDPGNGVWDVDFDKGDWRDPITNLPQVGRTVYRVKFFPI